MKKRFYFIINAMLCIVICVLTFGFSIEGTFAWFFDSIQGGHAGTFEMARVKLVYDKISAPESYILYHGDTPEAMAAHNNLEPPLKEAVNNGATRHELDDIFAKWWEEDYSASNYYSGDGTVATGCMLMGKYDFTNESNVPVYLRISKAQLNIFDSTAPDTGTDAAYVTWSMNGPRNEEQWGYIKDQDFLLLDGGEEDNFYYYPKPVEPNEKISLIGTSYLLIGTNTGRYIYGDKVPDHFTIEYAEAIQATNNAVFMADGWSNVAEQLVPYTEDKQ